MSEIDIYQHKCIGIVNCPSTYPIVSGRSHKLVALYRLEEDVAEWGARKGDILLGGGSGESAALRISIPEAVLFSTNEVWTEFRSMDEIRKAYWNMNDAFVFCEGYAKLGWLPTVSIETWLTEHVIAFLLREYSDEYGEYCGPTSPGQDRSICRLPNLNSIEDLL